MPFPVVPPVGTSLAGFFLEERFVDETAPPGILADAIDPRNGEYLSISCGFEPTDAAVLAALGIKRGSGAAVESVRQRVQDLEILDPSAPGFIRVEKERALGNLMGDKQIVLEKVTLLTENTWAEAQIVYHNKAQDRPRSSSIMVRI